MTYKMLKRCHRRHRRPFHVLLESYLITDMGEIVLKQIRCYQYNETMSLDFPFKILTHKRSYNHRLHSHEYLQLCYIRKGRCRHVVGGRSSILVKGDFFAIPPFLEHEMTSINNEITEIVLIDFMPFFVNEQMRDYDELDKTIDYAYIKPFISLKDNQLPEVNLSSAMQAEVEDLIDKMTRELERKELGYQFSVKADLLKLLITVGRELERKNNPYNLTVNPRKDLYEAIEYIKENYQEPIKLEDMARLSGMAPTYFSNLFKNTLNKPFIKYLNEVRIRNAMDLLKNTNFNITEISMLVGYNHLSHFNRVFKQITGVTPTDFRKNSVENEHKFVHS